MSSIKPPQPKTLAAVKSGVVMSLIETLLEQDTELNASLPASSFAVTLAAPGGIRNTLSLRGGTKGATLYFPAWKDMIRVLSGEKGTVLPIPTGFRFMSALNTFQKSAAAVSRVMDIVPDQDNEDELKLKTKMLLTAALRGVCEVYNYDHWTLVKSRHIPEGTIAVRIKDHPDMGAVIRVGNNTMELDRKRNQDKVNAVLEFSTVSVCYQVLTGALPALGALGDSRVMIMGKLPMIQGLFPLLDRFGEIMQ